MLEATEILNASILIVDDLEANVMLLEQVLRNGGYTNITTTQNPVEVLGLHQQHRYDLILLDLQMPVMDGFEVLEVLKTVEPGGYLPVLVITAQPGHKLQALKVLGADAAMRHIPVLALSANAMPRDIENGLEAGFFRYLTKPIRVREFMEALDEALEYAAEQGQGATVAPGL